MREIKFRAFDTKTKELVEKFKITSFGNLQIYEHSFDMGGRGQWCYAGDAVKLMQYTGLKDKNGVEIYEGDIVRILYTDWISQSEGSNLTLGEYKDSISNVGKIVFQNCEFCIQFNVEGYTSTIFCGPHGQIKVIGNIHQHPELIKGE